MNKTLRNKLIEIVKERISDKDVSHDISHILRVLQNAERIAEIEGGDLDVLIPAALFHDLVVYPKNHPKSSRSQEESSRAAEKILTELNYPEDKIFRIKTCILECSFTKGIIPNLLESKILQDADMLESTGAISIMRIFSTTGQLARKFYDMDDPFCTNRSPEGLKHTIDVFYSRLLKIKDRIHTESARRIAERRHLFLEEFLEELRIELSGG